MGIISSEYGDRLEHWIRTLKEDFYTPLGQLSWKMFRTMEQLSLEEAKAQDYRPAEPGVTWGNTYEYGWFFTEVRIPYEAEGKMIALDLNPGGESTVFVNGKPFGTYRADWVKQKHHYVEDNILTWKAKGGEHFEIYMETYAGHYYPEERKGRACATGPVLPGLYRDWLTEGARRTLGKGTFGIWDEDAYQLYMDVETLRSLFKILDEDSLRASKIADGLEAFTLTVDFEQEKEARTRDYQKARQMLRPLLEASNGSTMPEFFAVGNAHLDLAWLWPMAETYRKTARTFAAQLRLIKQYKDYRYIQSQPACYEMCRKYYPELFEEIRQAVKDGQWIAEGAMWVEPDTNIAGGEALIRQLLYGKAYYREMFGVDSKMLWLPDTFGYSGALPQILKKCGVSYLVTQKIFWSYNEGEQFPYHYFAWKGIDGTGVQAFLPTSYTYDPTPEEMNRVWKNRAQKRNLDSFLIPFGYGDGGGGPARDHIEFVMRQKDLEGGVRMEMGNPVDYFRALEEKGGPADTYTGELYFTAHRGTYTSQAAIKKWNRKAEISMKQLELWGAVAGRYPAERIESLWKEVLLNQFHDILPGSSIRRVYEEAEKSLERVCTEAGNLCRDALESLVKPGEGITVFNGLSFPRTRIIKIPEKYKGGVRASSGQKVFLYEEEGLAMVEIPAFGAVTLYPCENEAKERGEKPFAQAGEEGEAFVLENEYLRVCLNHKAEVTSFILKENGKEFAKTPMNRFRMFKDVPRKFDAWDIDSNYVFQETEGAFDVQVKIGASHGAMAVLEVQGRIGSSSYRQTISLEAGARRLEFDTEIDWRERHRLLKASFPTVIYGETGINEIQFGYTRRPMHRSRVYDKERFEVCNHRYSAVCDEGNGFAVLNDCKYGISMEDGALELTLLRAAASPDMEADQRVHRFTYGVTAWSGSFRDCDVVRQGYEINEKPLVIPGSLEPFSLAGTDSDHVIIESVKLAEDGSKDMIFRMYECKNAMGKAGFWVNRPVKSMWLCDMLEEKQEELDVKDGRTELDFGAFEIKTVRVSC